MSDPRAELERLEPLIGRWRTQGWTLMEPAERIDAIDTYERLRGGALLHLVDARVGSQKVDGAEIIGYDPARGGYATQYFGTEGPTAYEADLAEVGGSLVWTMRSDTTRFTGTFSEDGGTITGDWEALDEGSRWQPWMQITLVRQAP